MKPEPRKRAIEAVDDEPKPFRPDRVLELVAHKLCVEDAMKEIRSRGNEYVTSKSDYLLGVAGGRGEAADIVARHLSELEEK